MVAHEIDRILNQKVNLSALRVLHVETDLINLKEPLVSSISDKSELG